MRNAISPRLYNSLWYAAALAACLVMWAVNRAPLAYVDTGAYFAQGAASADALGLDFRRDAAAGAEGGGAAGSGQNDDVVTGSRSATYALFLTLATRALGAGAAPVLQSALLVLAVFLTFRVASRTAPGAPQTAPQTAPATALAIGAACLGSAAFYTVYLMPDIFTPIMILCLSALTLFAGVMRWWELLLSVLLAAWAVTTHPSHLLIAGLAVPAAILVALAVRPRRGWLGIALVGLVAVAGLAERAAFKTVVETVQHAEVVYQPFLTVRFIVDGPGMDRLADVCPSDTLATCDLYAALEGHPERIDASQIMFGKSDELGSFALLDGETQKRIAYEQSAFVSDVIRTHPVGVALAVLGNMVEQLETVSVVMTLPIDNTLDLMAAMTDELPQVLWQSRLTQVPPWLDEVEAWHRILYRLSAVLVLALMVMPRAGPPARIRGFVAMVLLGVLANALVCGGISQPAERYGARVIFLLPMMLVVLLAYMPFWRRERVPVAG
jgi:hypothetical protein